jgi:hypothetical protein
VKPSARSNPGRTLWRFSSARDSNMPRRPGFYFLARIWS